MIHYVIVIITKQKCFCMDSIALSTLRTIPLSFWYSLHPHTGCVEPNYGACRVITGDHLSRFWLHADKNTTICLSSPANLESSLDQYHSHFLQVHMWVLWNTSFPLALAGFQLWRTQLLFQKLKVQSCHQVKFFEQINPFHSTLQSHKTLHCRVWFVLEPDRSVCFFQCHHSIQLHLQAGIWVTASFRKWFITAGVRTFHL